MQVTKACQVEIASINKKGNSYKIGLREGDAIILIDRTALDDLKLNDIKAMLTGKSGTEVHRLALATLRHPPPP